MHNSVHFFVQHALWEREKEESSQRQFCISTLFSSKHHGPRFKTRSDERGVVMRETTRSTGFGMGAFSLICLLGWRSSGNGAFPLFIGGKRGIRYHCLFSLPFLTITSMALDGRTGWDWYGCAFIRGHVHFYRKHDLLWVGSPLLFFSKSRHKQHNVWDSRKHVASHKTSCQF